MITSSVNQAQSQVQTTTAAGKSGSAGKSSVPATSFPETEDSSVLSGEGRSRLETAREIMSRYDLRNISYNGLKELGRELYSDGVITGEEMLDMTAPTFDSSSLPGNSASDPRFSPDTPYNYLAMYEELLAFQKSNSPGDRKSIAWTERTLSLFRNFESMQP